MERGLLGFGFRFDGLTVRHPDGPEQAAVASAALLAQKENNR